MNRRLHGVAREAVEVRRGRREAPVLAGLPPPHPEEVETSHWKQGLRFLATGARANRRSDPGRYGTVLTKSDRAKPRLFDCRAPRAKLWPSVRRGASLGDGVFVPVSPVSLLIRPNRMTVSPGPAPDVDPARLVPPTKRGSSSEPPPSGRARVVSRTAARIITYPLRPWGLRKRPIAQTALCPPNRDEPFDSLHIPARARGALAR